MKTLFFSLLFTLTLTAHAQQDCQYTIMETGAGNEIKSTPEYLMHEKVFGGTSSFVFFSLTNSNGIPVLNFQLVAKSKEFPKAYCLDKKSKIYLQLMNGKVITLLSALDEQCASLMYDSEQSNNIRILTGSFLFTKGSPEELEKSPISIMRVIYATEIVDYNISKELTSQTNPGKYMPESYFMNYLKCIM